MGTSIYSVESFVIPDLIGDPFVFHRKNGLENLCSRHVYAGVVAAPRSRE
jgi:hypothetical protein